MPLITEKHNHDKTLFEDKTVSLAVFSECKRYRYYLEWRWNITPLLYVCMLNPSTATAHKLDPTIQGLVKRAKMWGYGGVAVVNLFAFRSTDPHIMLSQQDPIGPENDNTIKAFIANASNSGSPFIVAWGEHGGHKKRWLDIVNICAELGVSMQAFDTNKSGQPKHPLYCKHEKRLEFWSPKNEHTT